MKQYYHVGHMISAVSELEMNRRWHAIQTQLERANVDCLLMYGMEARQGAPVKYTINWSCEDGQGYTIVVPRKGKGAVFGHGYYGTPTIPPECVSQIEFNVAAPMAPVLGYTDMYIPRLIVEYLGRLGPIKRVGIYRRNILPWHFVQYVKECFPDVEIVDCDELYDSVKAMKSDEEIETLIDSARFHDQLFAAMNIFIRPGRLEREINVDLRKAALDLDVESLNIFIGSGKTVNDLEPELPMQMQTRRLEDGDMVKVVIKNAMRGGYFSCLGRMWSIGEPSSEYQKAVEDSIVLEDVLASKLVPGASTAELCREAELFRKANGYLPDDRLIGGAMGTEILERPVFLENESMKINDHMVFALYAGLKTDKVYASCCDSYLLIDKKITRITNTERKLFVI